MKRLAFSVGRSSVALAFTPYHPQHLKGTNTKGLLIARGPPSLRVGLTLPCACGVRITNNRGNENIRVSRSLLFVLRVSHRFTNTGGIARHYGRIFIHCSGTDRAWTTYWPLTHQKAPPPCGNSKDSRAKRCCSDHSNLHSLLTDDVEVFHGLAVSTIFPTRRHG